VAIVTFSVLRIRQIRQTVLAHQPTLALAWPGAFVKHRAQRVFLCLILSLAAHSIEEYVTKLYEVFAPARFVSSLVSQDLTLGFVVVNAALVTFGLWSCAIPVRSGWQVARGLMWFWTILELANGVGHSAFALSRGDYFPGVATAPLLLFFAGWLAVLQTCKAGRPSVLPS
jgi:hypothetical protein